MRHHLQIVLLIAKGLLQMLYSALRELSLKAREGLHQGKPGDHVHGCQEAAQGYRRKQNDLLANRHISGLAQRAQRQARGLVTDSRPDLRNVSAPEWRGMALRHVGVLELLF